MSAFDYQLETINTSALVLKYFMVPWDTEITGFPVAEIQHIHIVDETKASEHFAVFRNWCEDKNIQLCSCRVAHDRLKESMFLESQGFRFIELNYRPLLVNLQGQSYPEEKFVITPASECDGDRLSKAAGRIFEHGRFHQDPKLGPALGNRRYAKWMQNSFVHTDQTVIKCCDGDRIVAFFVVEYPEHGHCYWLLNGLVTGFQDQGLGKHVWRAMLRWHQQQGIDSISTSISSHNVAVFNLYVSLGFKFPLPQATFHWINAGSNKSETQSL